MAKTDEPDDSFIREVDEEYRRDQMKSLWQRYGRWLIAALVIGLATLAGVLYWREDQTRRQGATGEQFVQAIGKIETGDVAGAGPTLAELQKSGAPGYRALALLMQAANAVQAGDDAAALKLYNQVAADTTLAPPFRDLALVKATRLEFDALKPETVIARLKPLSTPGNPWFGVAGEMTGVAYLRSGKPALAEPLFTAIANDVTLEPTLRDRAAQLASALAGASGRAPLLQQLGDAASADGAAAATPPATAAAAPPASDTAAPAPASKAR